MDLRFAGRGVRRLTSRRTRRRLLVATVLALVAGGLAASTVARAERSERAYGQVVDVPVVRRAVPAGSVVSADDVERRSLPVAAVPQGAATDPVGRTARVPLFAGEVLLEARLGGSGPGPSALLRAGQRAVVVPVDERSLTVSVGDHVDVLAPDDSAMAPSARRVARNAEVVAVDEAVVTVAVLVAEAPGVARAVLDGAVALALVGPAP